MCDRTSGSWNASAQFQTMKAITWFTNAITRMELWFWECHLGEYTIHCARTHINPRVAQGMTRPSLLCQRAHSPPSASLPFLPLIVASLLSPDASVSEPLFPSFLLSYSSYLSCSCSSCSCSCLSTSSLAFPQPQAKITRNGKPKPTKGSI